LNQLNPPSAFIYLRQCWSWSHEFGHVYITELSAIDGVCLWARAKVAID